MKTPQQHRRLAMANLFNKILGNKIVRISPISIRVEESLDSDFTNVDLAFVHSCNQKGEIVSLKNIKSKGFVDGVFKACYDHYVPSNPSLKNIKLVTYEATPKIKKQTEGIGADAQVRVSTIVEVANHGFAEFTSNSRSILYSSLVNILEAFEFYINCECSFNKIQVILEDAKQRNRSDIVDKCKYDLAKLTGVNNYERKES